MNLLLRKRTLVKEGKQIYIEYLSIFGNLFIKRYELLMEIVDLRKRISFCVKKANYGQEIKADELESYIELEMVEYNAHLKDMLEAQSFIKDCKDVTIFDAKMNKKLYYDIAKKIHPDLHPNITDEQLELFGEATAAYEANDTKELIRIHDICRSPLYMRKKINNIIKLN